MRSNNGGTTLGRTPATADGRHESQVTRKRPAERLLPGAVAVLALAGFLALAMTLMPRLITGPPGAPSVAPQVTDSFTFEYLTGGVRRLVDDGAGHRVTDSHLLALGPDAAVIACCEFSHSVLDQAAWLLGARADPWGHAILRLGQREPLASWGIDFLTRDRVADIAVARDGTLWLAGEVVSSTRGGSRTPAPIAGPATIVATGADGSVWVGLARRALTIGLVQGDVATILSEDRGLPGLPGDERWASEVTGIAPTPDGGAWVGVGVSRPGHRVAGGLLRFDGGRWRIVHPLGHGVAVQVRGLTAARDGRPWVVLVEARDEPGDRSGAAWLASFDGSSWAMVELPRAVSGSGIRLQPESRRRALMEAAQDGSLWLALADSSGCRHLLSFDGATFRSHLPRRACVLDLAVAEDGAAWVMVGSETLSGIYLVPSAARA